MTFDTFMDGFNADVASHPLLAGLAFLVCLAIARKL